MKVVYENMRVKVDAAIDQATANNRVIERIELNPHEFSSFMFDSGMIGGLFPGQWQTGWIRSIRWRGVELVEVKPA